MRVVFFLEAEGVSAVENYDESLTIVKRNLYDKTTNSPSLEKAKSS